MVSFSWRKFWTSHLGFKNGISSCCKMGRFTCATFHMFHPFVAKSAFVTTQRHHRPGAHRSGGRRTTLAVGGGACSLLKKAINTLPCPCAKPHPQAAIHHHVLGGRRADPSNPRHPARARPSALPVSPFGNEPPCLLASTIRGT
jgi:hypothetical protein